MKSALFRTQAIQSAGDVDFGAPVALMPWSWWALLGFLLTVALVTLIFLATATFPRKETATGLLRYSEGEIRVAPPPSRAGIVTALHVRDGQKVQAGDVLAFVTTEQRLAGGGCL